MVLARAGRFGCPPLDMSPTALRGKLLLARTGLLCFLLAIWLVLAGATRAESGYPLEYPVKAAFLYKFALYVEWPESAFDTAESPVSVGVLGPMRMLEQVEGAVRGRSLAGRPVTVSRVVDQDLSRFHILFVARSEQASLARQSIPGDLPMLVVTESPAWQDLGSVINFVLADERIRFDVDLASAERRGLDVSAQLLNVARDVRGKP